MLFYHARTTLSGDTVLHFPSYRIEMRRRLHNNPSPAFNPENGGLQATPGCDVLSLGLN